MPVLLEVGLCFLLGVVFSGFAVPPLGLCVGLWLVGLVGLWCGQRRAGWLAALACGGLAVAGLPEGPRLRGLSVVQGVVIAAPVGRQAELALSWAGAVGGPLVPVQGRVRVSFPDRAPPIGATVYVLGEAVAPRARALPGAPDPVRADQRSRLHTLLYARVVAAPGVALGPPPPSASAGEGVLRAVATGDRSGVDAETWARLRRTGTAHAMAISGFHVGVVAAIAAALCRFPLQAAALRLRGGLPGGLAWVGGAWAGFAYAWAAGAPLSAQRASLLVGLGALARLGGRPPRAESLLAVVAMLLVALDPSCVAQPAFQLSFGAVIGLMRVGPTLTGLVPDWLWGRWLALGVLGSTAATIGTLAPSAFVFQQVAPLSSFANVVALPLFSCWIIPCALGQAFGPSWIAGWSGWLGEWGVWVLMQVLAPFDVAPLTPAVGPLGAALLLLPLCFPRRAISLTVLLCVWLWAGPSLDVPVGRWQPGRMELVVLDVGQGDASYVREPSGRRWLVDGGPPGDGVLRWLRRSGVRRLDVVVATHGDADHAGGLVPVLNELEVGELWVSELAPAEAVVAAALARGVPVRRMGTPARLAGLPLEGANDGSLPVLLGPPGQAVLLPGDLPAHLEPYLPVAAGCAVLRVPHHGSDTASSEALLARLSGAEAPLAIVSVGLNNHYGHPSAEVVARLEGAGMPVLRTDQLGTIRVMISAGGRSVQTYRPGVGWRSWPGQPASGPRISAPAASLPWSKYFASTPNTRIAAAAMPRLMPWLKESD